MISESSVINTLGAAVLLSAMQSSFSFLDVDPYLQKSILGIVLLIAFSMRFIQTALDRHVQRFRLRRQVVKKGTIPCSDR